MEHWSNGAPNMSLLFNTPTLHHSNTPTLQHSTTPRLHDSMETLQFTSFYVGDSLLGVNAKQVQEVLHYQKITPVSLMPDYVRGLLNLRGQIVTVLDLRSLFGFPPIKNESFRMFIVVQEAHEAICLFVDRMHTIVDVQPDCLCPPPGRVQDTIARYVGDVCQLDDELLLILDLEQVLQ